MAQYKLIQDIEAEDKILGPLTFRQFVFALAAAFFLYLSFIVVVRHAVFLLAIFLPPALFCAFFAVPFGRDQPTEVWFLAKLQFWFKPRKRVWNQSGVKELVTITVPKKIEKVLTKGFSQTEVKSRLKALADTIDSRGWAIKNVSSAAYAQPVVGSDSDRLIDISALPQEVPTEVLPPAEDILDETNNPIARQFEDMIDRSARSHRQQLLDQLNGIRQEQAAQQQTGDWFTGGYQAASATVPATPTVAGPAPVASDLPDEAALAATLASRSSSRQESLGNLRTMRPLSSHPPVPPAAQPPVDDQQDTVTAPDDPAILSLAKNNDLNVATLAREARKKKGDDEVVIPLH